MVQELKRKIPGIRIAIFAHGDYCDAGSTYVTKYLDFSNDPNTICNFVRNVAATGGGDTPECYELVMREVQENLSWSPKSQKSVVMIGDAPPHDKSEGQNYRHLDWKEEAIGLRRKVGSKLNISKVSNKSWKQYPTVKRQLIVPLWNRRMINRRLKIQYECTRVIIQK